MSPFEENAENAGRPQLINHYQQRDLWFTAITLIACEMPRRLRDRANSAVLLSLAWMPYQTDPGVNRTA